MKKIIIISLIVVISWYGTQLYKSHDFPFIQNSTSNFESREQLKCITKEGRVLYGSLPQGTVCERLEPVKGSLIIVSGKTFSRHNDDKKNKPSASSFKCDGRTYCSQMRSCEEATFFLRNCPNINMDGNNDGIPCEKQWCR